ncbi:hypothetical protein SBRCBS47491_001340 [Sporothrix bragantina]|uniref:Uncharacterized protein n=1 Tax=Sporothrix bragantina TaxID=671064 RepID=A0ABP0AXQ0_9PEZI
MPSRDRQRHHDVAVDCPSHTRNSGRKSGGSRSGHGHVSPEASGHPNSSPYPPRSSTLLAPSNLSSSTQRSGGGSGRSSRTSDMMMSLFGRRSSRRERSDSDPPSPRRVPVVEDVFLKPSVPNYIRNGTGYENIPAPPYEHGTAGATPTTGKPTTGAPREHRRSSPHRRDRHRDRDRDQLVPKKIRAHICNSCGRVRSRKFHDANPLRSGKKPIVNFCRKCRSLFDMEHDD